MNCIFQVSFLLLSGVFYINASEDMGERLKKEQYQKYFAEQDILYREIKNAGISGVRRLKMDENLAESVLANCPNQVHQIISNIKHNRFFNNKKNIIFYGAPGTGKSALAQAIAIKCQIPCLSFKAGAISTTYMNSGVQNLNIISEYSENLAEKRNEPFMLIYDELESLTKKHTQEHNPETNILIEFWQQLDDYNNSKVFVIATMNSIQDVPSHVASRTCMIEVSLPKQKQREAIIAYYLKKRKEEYNLEYPEWLTAIDLAQKTNGFSSRDLENVVTEALNPAIAASDISDENNKVVQQKDVLNAIKQIKKDQKEKPKKGTFTNYLSDPKNILSIAHFGLAAWSAYNQPNNLKMQMVQTFLISMMQKEIQERQMAQTQSIADKQMSTEQITKNAAINVGLASVAWIILAACKVVAASYGYVIS